MDPGGCASRWVINRNECEWAASACVGNKGLGGWLSGCGDGCLFYRPQLTMHRAPTLTMRRAPQEKQPHRHEAEASGTMLGEGGGQCRK